MVNRLEQHFTRGWPKTNRSRLSTSLVIGAAGLQNSMLESSPQDVGSMKRAGSEVEGLSDPQD